MSVTVNNNRGACACRVVVFGFGFGFSFFLLSCWFWGEIFLLPGVFKNVEHEINRNETILSIVEQR